MDLFIYSLALVGEVCVYISGDWAVEWRGSVAGWLPFDRSFFLSFMLLECSHVPVKALYLPSRTRCARTVARG